MSGWDDKPTIIGYAQRRGPGSSGLTKSNALATAQRVGAVSEIGAKGRSQVSGPADHQRIAKLDREDAPEPPAKVDISVGRALAAARQAKKTPDGKSMTQKDLATAVNAKPQDIADLESGRAVPNQQLLAKLERVVGVKLRGAPSTIGQPLSGPKKSSKI